MNILLTGAFGNIGSYVLAELLRREHTVRCLTLDTPADRRRAAQFPQLTDVRWADITDADAVEAAVDGMDVVAHFAALIPPGSEANPELARAVNVDGTANVIAACQAQSVAPRLIFASTFDVHGDTLHKTPPRQIDDPLEALDDYSAHKIECEAMVRTSGLECFVPRFVDVPVIGLRKAEPIMFEIGLANRIEVLHPLDAAVAVANALDVDAVWGRTLFIGGGEQCQVTYREFLTRIMGAMGLQLPPDGAFADKPYATDWVDTAESQQLLRYQQRDFDAITADIAALLGVRRYLMPVVRPFVQRSMLKMSPYWAG
ncbi:NAD(P)-dependent oxidoreductase [Aldersonia sp. NBC_00410]|uniref:NAD-dependent epimerase/dehydratase family protein n=1 Tax=Aldersonia sp. NBC_00410 TaxID=2975954 RepID=UPI00225605D4|nr:NAD(P)-dependent oxidoreductase [Aldersonia sp. NBC_00410]MCX5043394.1 NAD(P)-dependent oxidoreductase [Aldersonia sp. NBC_00410]